MPRTTRYTAAIVSLLLLSSACKGFVPPAPAATAPQKSYNAVFVKGHSEHKPQVESREEPLAPKVSQFLGTDRRVALLPPDQCEKKAMTEGASAQLVDIARTDCGNFMSNLEIELARQGYTVISWQRLRTGRSVADSFEAAKTLGADVVVEIDQLSVGTPQSNSQTITNIAFTESNPDGSQEKPVGVSTATQQQCLNLGHSIATNVKASGTEAVMAAKAVDIKSGTAVWYYSHSEFVDAEDKKTTYERRIFPVQGVSTAPTYDYKPGGLNGLQQAASWVAVGGILTTGLGILIPVASDNPVTVNVPIVLGGVALVSSIVLAIVGNVRMRSYEGRAVQQVVNVTYPPADGILCNGPGVSPVAPPPAVPIAYPQTAAAVQNVTTVTHATYDPARKAIEQLSNHFAVALKRAASSE